MSVAISPEPAGREVLELIGKPKMENLLRIIDDIRADRVFQTSLPPFLEVEITKRCNLRCVMCWGPDYKTDLPFARFERLASPLLNTLVECRFGGVGEPMIHPDFFDFVRLLGKGDVPLTFVTNGTLLTREAAAKLVRSSLYQIQISLDAATESTYRSIRHTRLATVLQNVRTLMALIRQAKRDDIVPVLAFVMMVRNLEEAPALVRLAGDLGIRQVILNKGSGSYFVQHPEEDISAKPDLVRDVIEKCYEIGDVYDIRLSVLFDAGVPPTPRQLERQRLRRAASHLESALWSSVLPPDAAPLHIPCRKPFTSIWVTVHGKIHPCCWYTYPLARIDPDAPPDVYRVWNSPEYQILRQEMFTRSNHLCRLSTCPIYQELSGRPPPLLMNAHGRYYRFANPESPAVFSGPIAAEEVPRAFGMSPFYRVIYDESGCERFADFFQSDFRKEYTLEYRYGPEGSLQGHNLLRYS